MMIDEHLLKSIVIKPMFQKEKKMILLYLVKYIHIIYIYIYSQSIIPKCIKYIICKEAKKWKSKEEWGQEC